MVIMCQKMRVTHFSFCLVNALTDLWGAGGTGRRGADGTFLDKVESWRDRGEAKVLDAVTRVSSVSFPVLADR